MLTTTRHLGETRQPTSDRKLTAPLAGTGLLMAGYLITRPYGDATGADSTAAAEAFASPWWVFAHVCGALAIAFLGRLALRLHDLTGTLGSRAARTLGLAGAALVLPYYGLETFGLHAVGRAALAGDLGALDLVDALRNHPAALTMFGLGLLLLAAAGVLMAIVRQCTRGGLAAWPLGLMVAGLLPQFFLPPTGRIAYGVLYAVAAGVWLLKGTSKTT